MRSNPGQYYLDLGECSSGVGWLCSTRYRGVRDDAVSPAGPSLFETGMDLLDAALGSGGGDQVRVRGGVRREFHGSVFRGDRVRVRGGDFVSCWGRTFIQDDCTLAPVICDRTLSSCGKYVPGAARWSLSLPVRALSQRCPSRWDWVRSARRCPNLQQRPRPGSA